MRAVLLLAEDLRGYGSFAAAYNCSAKAQTTFSVSTAGYPGGERRAWRGGHCAEWARSAVHPWSAATWLSQLLVAPQLPTTASCRCSATNADKLGGYLYTSMHLSNQPTVTLKMCPTGAKKAVTSQLDVYRGQSGSPVWSPDGRVRAVHSAVSPGKTLHAPIDKEAVEFIKYFRK